MQLPIWNPATKDRDSEESLFFEESNFKSLPPSSVGISSLRRRLSQVLFDQVRSELPKLVEDIRSGIATTRDGLNKLGPSRVTPEEQRAFLIRVRQEFQILSRDAVNGQYSNPFFKDHLPAKRRLCAVITNSHDDFGANLRESGARWIIPESKGRKSVRGGSSSKYRTREEAVYKIQKLLRISRGRELVGKVFREYSEPWESIARSHIHSVWESTKVFLEQVLQHLTDAEVCSTLFYEVLESIMEEKLDLAYSKLSEVIAVYKDHPATLNHYFQENVVALQKDVPLLMAAMQFKETPDMNHKAAEEIFDHMNAFYKSWGSPAVKEHMILRTNVPAEDLARDEDTSFSSDEVVEITQSGTEESLDNHMPTPSPLEDTAFGSVEDASKPGTSQAIEDWEKYSTVEAKETPEAEPAAEDWPSRSRSKKGKQRTAKFDLDY
ncbi:MAG: hypothetical protein M1812_005805 [Candelaria pacifica]|nr:MAG: hypothetical protein M1812_005805 [Candelaria pacifica]